MDNEENQNNKDNREKNNKSNEEVNFDFDSYCKIEFPKDPVPYKRRKPEIFTAIKVVNKNNYKRYQPTYYLAQR